MGMKGQVDRLLIVPRGEKGEGEGKKSGGGDTVDREWGRLRGWIQIVATYFSSFSVVASLKVPWG